MMLNKNIFKKLSSYLILFLLLMTIFNGIIISKLEVFKKVIMDNNAAILMKDNDMLSLKHDSEGMSKVAIESARNVIHVNPEQSSTKSISEIFHEVHYIKLETNKESIFGNVGKLIIYKNRLYILDKKAMKNIYVFSMDGKFLYRILKNGRGPGELAEPVDFNIKDGHIYVLDWLLKKIAIYNLSGDLVEEKKINTRLLGFEFLNDGNVFALNEINGNKEKDSKLVLLSLEKNKILNKFFIDQNAQDGNLKFDNVFFTYGDSILYWQIFDNSIYAFYNRKIHKRYEINFGKYTIGSNLLKLPLEARLTRLNRDKEQYAGLIDNVVEETDRLYFSFLHNDKTYNVFYNKNSKKVDTFLLVDKEKNIEIKKIFTKTNNFYVSVVYPLDLGKENNLLNEIDNPMLILCKL